ncbi:MAG: hypothetical protein C0390_06965 [Syntrophus sp. (in: bacteria)]|nr:hypothetical protein [Syntrophus sp. (in: bacteria)]
MGIRWKYASVKRHATRPLPSRIRCIAGYYQLGMSIDEILDSLRHLTPSQIHSALAYYFDHQDEVNADLEEAGNVESWKSQVQTHPTRQ